MRQLRPIALAIMAAAILAGCRPSDSGPAADAFTVRGIDVSHHNGPINFNEVAADGIDFVFIKATDGTDVLSKRLTTNYTRARRAGLKVGLYHYFQFTTDPTLQALNFLNTADHRPSDFPLILDVETDERNNSKAIPTADVVRRLEECISTITREGRDVMIYSNKADYQRYIAGRFDTIPIWICALNNASPDHIPWTFWQHSHRGSVRGIRGNVDLNVFAGDSADFDAFLRARRNK